MHALTVALPRPMTTPTGFGMEFARAFREAVAAYEARLGKDLKQYDLGGLMGCSQSQAGKLLRGEARPNREIAERAAELFPERAREEWLSLAGYGPRATVEDERLDIARQAAREALEAFTADSPADILLDGLLQVQQEFPDADIPLPKFSGGRRALTADEARQTVENLREQLRRGSLP